jgi:hypothetical protein
MQAATLASFVVSFQYAAGPQMRNVRASAAAI